MPLELWWQTRNALLPVQLLAASHASRQPSRRQQQAAATPQQRVSASTVRFRRLLSAAQHRSWLHAALCPRRRANGQLAALRELGCEAKPRYAA
jgi:hypothetical protein